MELGPEVKIEGKRPEWLKDDEHIGIVWLHTRWDHLSTPAECVSGWEGSVVAIRLRADHPYYLATNKGFTYWPGGDSAPDDWDGGDVLMALGSSLQCRYDNQPRWDKAGTCSDIIGYRRKAKPAYLNSFSITRAEAYEDGLDIPTLEKLGLLAEETLLEKFEREHGGLDNNQRDIVEAFINWQGDK